MLQLTRTPLLARRNALILGGVAAGTLMTRRAAAAAEESRMPTSEMEKIIGADGRLDDGVFTIDVARKDLSASLPGNIPVKPAFQLNGSFNFQAIEGGKVIMNSDYCLKPEETNHFMDALIAGGLTVMAFHQHLYDMSPNLWFVHFRGIGEPLAVAKALRKALNVTSIPLPQQSAKNPTSPIDAGRISKILGVKTRIGADGVVHAEVPRAEQIHLAGIAVKPGLNVSAPIAFQPLDSHGEKAVAVPDFAMLGDEVDKVFAEMRKQGFTIGCLYNQETDERPQLYFSHQWAVGNPYQLATSIRRGLDLTNSKVQS